MCGGRVGVLREALDRLLYFAPHGCKPATNVTLGFCRFRWDRWPHKLDERAGLAWRTMVKLDYTSETKLGEQVFSACTNVGTGSV